MTSQVRSAASAPGVAMNFSEKPFYLLNGDSNQKLLELPENSVDAVVTDPPYELGFMGKSWDATGIAYSVEFWKRVMRVMKPGAHILAFSGTRTYHRMVVAMEDAGFEIRDQLQWNFGSGFPKSLDIRKAVAKMGVLCECEKTYQLRCVRKNILEVDVLVEAAKGDDMQLPMQRDSAGGGMGETRPQGAAGLDADEPRELSAKNERTEQPGMEGRSHLQAEQGELHRAEIREISKGIVGDVPQGRIHNGAPANNGKAHGKGPNPHRSGPPQGPQHPEQPDNKSRILSDEQGAQNCGRCGKAKAIKFEGWGTALKPANEPIVLARKPLEKDTVAKNVLKWGTGGLNIDAGRIGTEKIKVRQVQTGPNFNHPVNGACKSIGVTTEHTGRFPSNVLLDEEAARLLDEQSGTLKNGGQNYKGGNRNSMFGNSEVINPTKLAGDSGGASRFFFVCLGDEATLLGHSCENTSAQHVALLLKTILAPTENIALTPAQEKEKLQLDRNVKSAGIECEQCATFIAQSIAEMRTPSFGKALPRILEFMRDSESSIQTQNLASHVEILASIVTTPTTDDLLKLFGCAHLAIEEFTKQENQKRDNDLELATRFRYTAKTSKWERNYGLDGMEEKTHREANPNLTVSLKSPRAGAGRTSANQNVHPTVKPFTLMRYLVRLITPPGGIVLDPFLGSGTTGAVSVACGFKFIGIEKEAQYFEIAKARIEDVKQNPVETE